MRLRHSFSGRGSAWLERLVRDQEVGGSNPLAPTNSFNNLQGLDEQARVFIIDGLRTPGQSGANPHGVNEVRYRNGRIVREGLHSTLTDLRLRKHSKSARDRWQKICPGPSFFIVGTRLAHDDAEKLCKRKSLAFASTLSRAESGSMRASSTAPIIVEKIAKKARSLSAVRLLGMNGIILSL